MIDITGIRYINLDKNWHRRFLVNLALKKQPVRGIRCSGVEYDSSNPDFEKYLKFGIEPYLVENYRCKGVIGCWIAHSLALEEVTERNGITIVLEDDFMCQDNFFNIANSMVENFQGDFDVIFFDPWGTGPLEGHKICDNIYFPKNSSYPYYGGSHCLFVNNAKIPKILELKLNSAVKDYDGYLLANEKIISYVFYTGLSGSRNIDSSINRKSNNETV